MAQLIPDLCEALSVVRLLSLEAQYQGRSREAGGRPEEGGQDGWRPGGQVLQRGLQHPSLEGRYTPWVSAQESRQPPVLFDTNANKMALAFMDSYGRFLRNRV